MQWATGKDVGSRQFCTIYQYLASYWSNTSAGKNHIRAYKLASQHCLTPVATVRVTVI